MFLEVTPLRKLDLEGSRQIPLRNIVFRGSPLEKPCFGRFSRDPLEKAGSERFSEVTPLRKLVLEGFLEIPLRKQALRGFERSPP